jgi:hypothetical protein
VTEINRAGQTGSLGHIDTTQAQFRGQVDLVADELRQLAGNADLPSDPLSAPYVLYVNGYTGQDTFVGGAYQATEVEIERRISLQKLECGYSEARPFKTINRAAIEAAIITSRDWFTTQRQKDRALVSIVVAPGEYIVLNDDGKTFSPADFPARSSSYEPTDADLISFNDPSGGVILPRGCSVVSLDLRKTLLRPNAVPASANEAADYSNRRSIFKVSGTGYYYGFTFKDQLNATHSHHLLHCFEFCSQAELDLFYQKILASFAAADLSASNTVSSETEYQIVGPLPSTPTSATDTVGSASPYIYNTSVRSVWGMGGVFANGNKPEGFRSMVIAQFTSVSLQQDMGCWQLYSSGAWGTVADYTTYINASPDNVRMNPDRKSFHIRAINNAVIQEVSVFAIGQGVHHWTQSGGELTITNSNSNFGGCAALSEDYRTYAFNNDQDWTTGRLRVASNLAEKRGNVVKIYVGDIADGQTDAAIQSQNWFNLGESLEESVVTPGEPRILQERDYTFRQGSWLWIENPIGADYRVQLPANTWDVTDPDKLNFLGTVENEDGIQPGQAILAPSGVQTGQYYPSLAGRRVYIRRLRDNRSSEAKRFSVVLNNTNNQCRLPVRDYVAQTPTSGIPNTEILTVLQVGGEPASGAGVKRTASVVLRRQNPAAPWTPGRYYRPGDNATADGKHYMCVKETTDTSFLETEWQESFVHMEETYNNEDFLPNAQPEITFDNDTDGSGTSVTCGYDLATVWSTDSLVINQYRTATDYLGIHSFLVSIGFSASDAHTILLPRAFDDRDRNPGTQLDGIAPPSGAATTWTNWPLEFRRPSIIRLFGHAWEWAGYLNYTKAMPQYQQELGNINRFTYYFTHQNGGRVYASGFNQEGFLVNNRGLEDLATGSVLSVDQLGSDEYTIDFPTYYENLSVDNLAVNSQLNLTSAEVVGRPTWQESGSKPYLATVDKISMGPFGGPLPELPLSTQTQEGVIRLATASEAQAFVRNDLAISPATLIEALGDAVKSVVNCRISLSSTSAILDSNQSGSTVYLHPYSGNELALYDNITGRWRVRRFSSVLSFSLATANVANTNYDVYLYDTNPTDSLNGTFALEYTAWSGDRTPPARGNQDGILVKNGEATKRLIGVIRTTSAGNSIVSLGGVITGANSANYPRVYIANLYNLYDVSSRYFFGNSWGVVSSAWSTVPASVYPTTPRCSFVQASETLVTAFLDIYSNYQGSNWPTDYSFCYVAPGIDSVSSPPDDAFYGETIGMNDTAGSQWARTLGSGVHDIYYLYKMRLNGGVASNEINQHAAHGLIITTKA